MKRDFRKSQGGEIKEEEIRLSIRVISDFWGFAVKLMVYVSGWRDFKTNSL